MKVRYFAIALSIILWAVSVNVTQGYEVVELTNGATLKGAVAFNGTVPPDETIVIDKDVEYCGKEQQAGTYVVSNSRVKNVVVWVEGIEKGKAIPKKSVDVTIEKCMARPHVSVGFVGGKFAFKNEDDIFHTIQLKLGLAYQKQASQRPLKDGATIYNLAFPIKGLQIKKRIKKYHKYTKETGFIQIRSNTHDWIRGYIFIFDHPYVGVTDEKGTFVIDNILPGEYLLRAWHEGFGMQERTIKVTSGEIVESKITFSQ
jgi:hypothetical protein